MLLLLPLFEQRDNNIKISILKPVNVSFVLILEPNTLKLKFFFENILKNNLSIINLSKEEF
jgi:hypothetical protein